MQLFYMRLSHLRFVKKILYKSMNNVKFLYKSMKNVKFLYKTITSTLCMHFQIKSDFRIHNAWVLSAYALNAED